MSTALADKIHENNIRLQKAILWEEAKGKLRAMVMAGGQGYAGMTPSWPDWEIARDAVEAFIKDFEDKGLEE